MIGVFIYGELVSTRNLSLVLESPVTTMCSEAKLLDYRMIPVEDGLSGAKESVLNSINGLLVYLDEEQVKKLINYYKAGFRLSTGEAVIDGIHKSVKFMQYCGGTTLIPYLQKESVERRLLSFSSLYCDNENERHFMESTIRALLPGRDVNWVASNYPYFVMWLREVGFDHNYMLPMVESEEEPDVEIVVQCLSKVFPNIPATSIRDLLYTGNVTTPMSLSLANVIDRAGRVLQSPISDVEFSMREILGSDTVQQLPMPCVTEDTSKYDALVAYSLECSSIEDSVQRGLYVLLVLRHLNLVLTPMEDTSNTQLDAYILNRLYMINIMEG